ncbi:P-loop containing nucleoside triphosphate hydrolase protein [Apiospora aurea]|uniref:P-loop containing nucleoside triphosphate hydrolase protein n=1 Tax=Apiospora aurea TaxID=335848 RepID=A0ABR1QTN2_9PEZI
MIQAFGVTAEPGSQHVHMAIARPDEQRKELIVENGSTNEGIGIAHEYFHLSRVAACDDQSPEHNLTHIAAIREEIKDFLDECQIRLKQMGEPRSSFGEARAYLVDFSKVFTSLLQDALKEDYSGPFSTEPLEGCEEEATHTSLTTLVAIREHLKDFSKHMNDPEHAQTLLDRDTASDELEQCTAPSNCEHSGVSNHEVFHGILMRKMYRWRDIIDSSSAHLFMAAQSVVKRVLNHLVGEDNAPRFNEDLYEKVGDELWGNIEDLVENKIHEPFETGYPIFNSPCLTKVAETKQLQHQASVIRQRITGFLGDENVTSGRYKGTFDLETLIDCVLGGIELNKADMDNSSVKTLAEQVADDYCKIPVQKAIDDFVANAELCMVRGLDTLFTSDVVTGLSDEKVYEIARDSEDAIRERQELADKMDVLRKTEELLCQLQDENRGLDA